MCLFYEDVYGHVKKLAYPLDVGDRVSSVIYIDFCSSEERMGCAPLGAEDSNFGTAVLGYIVAYGSAVPKSRGYVVYELLHTHVGLVGLIIFIKVVVFIGSAFAIKLHCKRGFS